MYTHASPGCSPSRTGAAATAPQFDRAAASGMGEAGRTATGPGVGPVAVRAHLAEFLPAHPLASAGRPVGAVSAAPFGSASILAISWVYIALMGASGLTDASAMAVLNANYIATRLNPHFPVLYTGEHGRVAHECILDLRPMTKATGVTVDDVAKRLIDYGLHAQR